MEFHEVASIFPPLSDDEYKALVEDIRQYGLRFPILTFEGEIIDGRHRWLACQELGVEPRIEPWSGEGSLVAFVVSANLQRRHLTSSQRAMLAVDVLPMLEAEAKKRQGQRTDLRPDIPQKVGESKHDAESTQQAAKMFHTNRQYVSDAKKLAQDAPGLAVEVREGKKTIPQVRREVRKRKKGQRRIKREPSDKVPLLIVGKAENMYQIANGSIDIIITSPPYNLGSDLWPMGGDGREPRDGGIGYQDGLPEDNYQEWQLKCLVEMYRVAKQGASLFYNHKPRNRKGRLIHPLDWLRDPKNPWILRQEIIWDRGSTHNHSPHLFWPHDERIYWFTKGVPILGGQSIGMSTIWRFHGPMANTWHPAPFAEELPRRCLQAINRPGTTVLDPFCGSCTTLRVALELGYSAIGVDVSGEYLEQAREENGWMRQKGN